MFEALHSQEPRGYVVGWIIAISLLVGILIFLLLAVLLWKVNTRALMSSSGIVCAADGLKDFAKGSFHKDIWASKVFSFLLHIDENCQDLHSLSLYQGYVFMTFFNKCLQLC